jgi:hypothetical protein
MKRSEMIEIIKAQCSAFGAVTPNELAKKILQKMEEVGAEPPKIKRKVVLEKKEDPNHIFSYVEHVNQWEPENE